LSVADAYVHVIVAVTQGLLWDWPLINVRAHELEPHWTDSSSFSCSLANTIFQISLSLVSCIR